MTPTIDELMRLICEQIAEGPVTMKVTESKACLILEIDVAPERRGRIIGKKGRTITSLRILAKAMGANHRGVFVEVCE